MAARNPGGSLQRWQASPWQVAAACLLVLLAGCRVEILFNSGFQPQVVNQTDNFQFFAAGLRSLSRTVDFSWQNTGTRASVTQSSSVTSGAATLRILDAAGAQVYSNDLSASGTFATRTGISGVWTIEVVLSDVSGTLNFHVQKSG